MSLETAMREIVAVQIGTTITNDISTIKTLLTFSDEDWQTISRAHMAFMAAADPGPQWKVWAEAPTLFTVDDKGDYHWPKAKGAK